MRLLAVLSVGILINLAYTFFTIDRQAIGELQSFPWIYLLVVLAMSLLPWLTSTLRLAIWLNFLKQRTSLREVFRAILASDVVSAVTPGAMGGGYYKLAWMIKRGLSAGSAASVMVVGTLEEILFFALALPVILMLSPETVKLVSGDLFSESLHSLQINKSMALSFSFGGVLAVAVVGVLIWRFLPLARREQMRALVVSAKTQVSVARQTLRSLVAQGKWRILLTMLLAGVQWTCRCALLVVLLKGLHYSIDTFEILLSQWLLFMFMALVPSPGATGGAEAGFHLVYHSLLPAGYLGLLSASWRVLTFTLPVGLAAVLFLLLSRWRKEPTKLLDVV